MAPHPVGRGGRGLIGAVSSSSRSTMDDHHDPQDWPHRAGHHPARLPCHHPHHMTRYRPSLPKRPTHDFPPDYMLPDHPSDLSQNFDHTHRSELPKSSSSPSVLPQVLKNSQHNSASLFFNNTKPKSSLFLNGAPSCHSAFLAVSQSNSSKSDTHALIYERGQKGAAYNGGSTPAAVHLKPFTNVTKQDFYGDNDNYLHKSGDDSAQSLVTRFGDPSQLTETMIKMQKDQSPGVELNNYRTCEPRVYMEERGGYPVVENLYAAKPWDSGEKIRRSLDSSVHRGFHKESYASYEGDMSARAPNGNNCFELHTWRRDGSQQYQRTFPGEEYGSNSLNGHNGRPMIEYFEDDYVSNDPDPIWCRSRQTSSIILDDEVDTYTYGVSPQRLEYMANRDQAYSYGNLDRIAEREIQMGNYVDGGYTRSVPKSSRNVFARLASSYSHDKAVFRDHGSNLHPNKLMYRHGKSKVVPRKFPKSVNLLPHNSYFHQQGRLVEHMKTRFRPSMECEDDYSVEGSESVKPYNNKRKSEVIHTDENTTEDPQENSEEFKQQVHQAFLKYSKSLNESLELQKQLLDPGNVPLVCLVCGSSSKKFSDTHNLVTHAFHCQKMGFKTKHLGLHKAICVLMGWSWLVEPDTSRLYLSNPPHDAKAAKEDLILWPPVVVLHNGLITKQATVMEANILTENGIENILTELGMAAGKFKVRLGKPANQSVFVVKFSPTLSGLLEAEKLAKHFTALNRGKKDLEHIKSEVVGIDSMPEADKVEEQVLYGYLAVAEDFVKLDEETMKRCVVKSKKDIEAIAEAPLKRNL